MGKKDRGRGRALGGGRERRVAPDPAEVLLAWANLVTAIVRTMREEGVGNDVIHGFLVHLDLANLTTLEGDMLDFVLFVTDEARAGVPSND